GEVIELKYVSGTEPPRNRLAAIRWRQSHMRHRPMTPLGARTSGSRRSSVPWQVRAATMKLSVVLAFVCLMAGGPSARADIIDDVRGLRDESVLLPGAEAKKLLSEQWMKYDPRALERRNQALSEIRELGKRLAEDQKARRSRDCSAQIYLEAKWRAL